MNIYLKEKIGNPELFTGRKQELRRYSTWIERIPREISMSQAILARRKTGKTALLQRLYNLTFEKNAGVIPFYFELREGKQWAVDFCREFFLTFLYQYIAFKRRNPQYIHLPEREKTDFVRAAEIARKEGLDYLLGSIEGIERLVQQELAGPLWASVMDAPYSLATRQRESIVQIIDEFQFLNSEIYWDEAKTNKASDFAAGYLKTAEYKNAPLLVSGSWVGWLFNDLIMMLPGRFQINFLEALPAEEALEMIFKYAQLEDIPVSDESAYLIAELTEGSPFYISALFRSSFDGKDLTTKEGVLATLEFETLDERGIIHGTWMEYIQSAFPRINAKYAKSIVLYLCRHKNRQVTRKELLEQLSLPMTEDELEHKMKALIKADIVNRGQTNFRYQAVQDNIFDKVFRGRYAEDIEQFEPASITQEYHALLDRLQAKYHSLRGKYSQMKGVFAEYAILNKLRTAFQRQNEYRSMMTNLPDKFEFTAYESVWSYYGTYVGKPDFQVDIFARAKEGASIIGEVKNRTRDKFTGEEAARFLEKAQTLEELEHVASAQGFVFSRSGFTPEALEFFRAHQIAWSEDERWLN